MEQNWNSKSDFATGKLYREGFTPNKVIRYFKNEQECKVSLGGVDITDQNQR